MKLLRMAQYPREIRIPCRDGGTQVYAVRWVSKKSRKLPKDTIAHCHPGDYVIRIKRGLGRAETFKSFIHEVLHAIEFEYPIKIKHKVIYELEDAIFRLLQLNI